MKADPRFLTQPKEFWAYVRTISQNSYTNRGNKGAGVLPSIKIPTLKDVRLKFRKLNLRISSIANESGELTDFGRHLFDYFAFRAAVLNDMVRGQLMRKDEAEIEFERLRAQLKPKCLLPMNKQKGAKKNHAFLTGMVNMLVEANIGGASCDYDPHSLTTMTRDG